MRRSTSIIAVCVVGVLGSLAIGWSGTSLSVASTPVPRAVYRTLDGITQAYLVGYPLSRGTPRDSSRHPHIAGLFSSLRLSHPKAVATYLRIDDARHDISFELAVTPYTGARWKNSPAYDLAMPGRVGIRHMSAAWIQVGATGFGLYALSASFHPTTNAVMMVQPVRVPGGNRAVLQVTFTTTGQRPLTLLLNRSTIVARSVLSLLLQAQLQFVPAPPTPGVTPTPVPSPASVATVGVATPTPVSQNAPTATRAATVHALGGAWQPSSVSIGVNAAVTWENDDASHSYSVECVQAQSSAMCPWVTPLPLPAASGGTTPTVSVTFTRPGIFIFRAVAHPDMQGEVVVGAPRGP